MSQIRPIKPKQILSKSRDALFKHTVPTRQIRITKFSEMPLVVPGINSSDNSKTTEWMNKLVGKKIGDDHGATTFAKSDLPKDVRVIQPGQMVTKDFKPDRLNVHVDKDGNVTHVDHQ